ncbi:rhomboid family intramembrane serine protease [Streptomyces polyrhachis]|uniref:Rhomboid family intramembrane serine protease n=1 Tax=Streptomyces polyrhachis TaxID=1282885 RepID=A0ABW2G9J0_9ACTN
MEASSTPTPGDGQAEASVCYRHPGVETHVRCTRCERRICPDCMRDAAVGYQCPECVSEGNKGVRHARTAFGGTIRRDFTPVVTYTLIALNVLLYGMELLGGDEFVGRFSVWGGAIEMSGGALYVYPDAGIAGGEWYRLLTGAFLHQLPGNGVGPGHLLMNMLLLWALGPEVEKELGRARYLALYLISALGGSVLAYVISPDQAAVGASGALFGLIAAFYLLTRRLGRPETSILLITLVWLVVSVGFTSWQGHLGGLLAGGATAWFFAYAPQKHRTWLHIAGPALVLVLLVAATVVRTASLTA